MTSMVKKRSNKKTTSSSVYWKSVDGNFTFNPLPQFEAMDEKKIIKVFSDGRFSVNETEGSSLSVLFNTSKEIRQVGWLSPTYGDSLEVEDWNKIKKHVADNGVFLSASADEILDMI